VIRANADGSLLKLGDIARVEFGAYSYNVRVKSNGLPGIVLAVYQAPGSNANEVETQIRQVLKNASGDFPAGISVSIPYSSKKVVDDSIEQVQHTLIEAFLLVFLVAYIFFRISAQPLFPPLPCRLPFSAPSSS